MHPNLSYFEGQLHMYYCAQKGDIWNIGEAIADVTFKNSGSWISREIKTKPKRIILKYEQPPQTNVQIFIVKKNEDHLIPLNLLDNRKEIRLNTYHSVIDINIKTPFKIQMNLKTDNESTSPMIYELNFNE
jgi:hypothetical protein